MTPTALRAFAIFSSIWFVKVSLESRVSPKCFCSLACLTVILLKTKRRMRLLIEFTRKFYFFSWFGRVRIKTHFPLKYPLTS